MKASCWVAAAVLAAAQSAAAQTIYKCVSKEGKTSYSASPCPGSTAVASPGAPGLLDLDRLTQAQADLAADCSEALFNASDPGWRDKERERTAFDKYCPAFGFKAPMGPETNAFNARHGDELIARLRRKFADVPSTFRTYTGGYRMPPSFEDAERVLRMAPRTAPAYQNLGRLPTVQAGRWSYEESRNGVAQTGELCGDPLENLKRELLQGEEHQRRGCAMRIASSSPHSITYESTCPSNAGSGSAGYEKRQVTVTARSPASLQILATAGGSTVSIQATRTGDCQ